MDHHLLAVFGCDVEVRRERGIECPFARSQFVGVDICVGCGMLAVFVHEKDGMEDLLRHVCVHGGGDVCDVAEIVVNEFRQPNIVFDCAAAGTSGDE